MPTSRRWSRLALTSLAAASVWAAPPVAEAVVGGRAILVQAAPWSVAVQENFGATRFLCSGSIIDARHVLTAAHCVYDNGGEPATPEEISIVAGVSDLTAPLAGDAEQERDVSAIRVHPGYVWATRAAPDDLAVLTLSSPLDLSDGAARALSLPRAGAAYPSGTVVGLAGFGRESPTTPSDGSLEWMTATVDPQGQCGATRADGLVADNAITLCAVSQASATCNGDSGAGLVRTGATPTLLGVVSGGPPGCSVGSHTLYTYLGAGETRAFVAGAASPPRAPRQNPATFINLTWPAPLVVGTTLACASGDWGSPVQLVFTFVTSDGRVLQESSRPSYVLNAGDRGLRVSCEVEATDAGGTAVGQTTATSPVAAAPPVTILAPGALAGSRGNALRLRVAFRAPRGLRGTFGACLTPPARVGHRVCASLPRQVGGPGTFSFELAFRVNPGAPLGPALLTIGVSAGVSSAHATALARIGPGGPREPSAPSGGRDRPAELPRPA